MKRQHVRMALFKRKRRDEPAGSLESGLEQKDVAVLQQLVQAGADLSEPRHAVYYLYFSSHRVAAIAAEEAQARGFQAEVREPLPQYPDQWPLVCELHDVILDHPTVRENTDFFESLAQRQSGEYDGWEASA